MCFKKEIIALYPYAQHRKLSFIKITPCQEAQGVFIMHKQLKASLTDFSFYSIVSIFYKSQLIFI